MGVEEKQEAMGNMQGMEGSWRKQGDIGNHGGWRGSQGGHGGCGGQKGMGVESCFEQRVPAKEGHLAQEARVCDGPG